MNKELQIFNKPCAEMNCTLRAMWIILEDMGEECCPGDLKEAAHFVKRMDSGYLPALYHFHSSLRDMQEQMEKALKIT